MSRGMTWLCALLALWVPSVAVAIEDVQWVRVTVLLETGPGTVLRAEESLIPGGVYSLEEVERRGLDAIDQEIMERVNFLGHSTNEVERSMRLATMAARQYYLALEVDQDAVLPVIDLNPRIGIVISTLRFVDDRAVCKVQFLEPEGPSGDPDFTGDPITLHLKNADLQKVLETFSQIMEIPIDVDPSIEGQVTVDLRDVQWDQALDLVLRTNDLGWIEEDGVFKVIPLDELSRRKQVRTEATINLPRGTWGSATVASRGDSENPTVVLVVESVDAPPEMVAERDGLFHPKRILLGIPGSEDLDLEGGGLAVFRGLVAEDGRLRDVKLLESPSQQYADRLTDALSAWQFRSVLDEEGRKHEAVVGYGVRIQTMRVLASIATVEHIQVEVKGRSVSPDRPMQYTFFVEVTDTDTGAILVAPMVTTEKGKEATVRSGLITPSGAPSEFLMKVFIAEDGTHLRYSWKLVRDGRVISSHSAEFEL
jgi:hypothetical protein